MKNIVRDAPFGQLVRWATGNKYFLYPEEKPDFVLPDAFKPGGSNGSLPALKNKEGHDLIPVTWYGPDDPDNPQNWKLRVKVWVAGVIMFYLIGVYIGSAIFAYAVHDAAEYFHISDIVAALAITFFVLGYAIGPLILAPLSEIGWIGRNPPYIISLVIFTILQVPTALATNFPGLAVLRFLAGFAGSPPLATGPASITDMFSPQKAAYPLGAYGLAGGVAPSIAPFISGFAVMNKGWRWAFWELLIMSGAALILIMFALPETSADNILYKRSLRLRKLTGNPGYVSASELADAERTVKEILTEAIVRPLTMTFTEPIVLAVDLYIGLTYMVLYSFFESFPMVFSKGGLYDFNLGVAGLPFLAVTIGGCISYAIFCLWNYYCWEPKYVASKGRIAPESQLPLSIAGAICFPICLFWFGWSAGRTHWISPTLAAAFFGLGDCLSFMPYSNYLAYAYPAYAASALASNDWLRSMLACGMPVIAYPLFGNLGIDKGNTVIGAITVVFIPLPFLLIKYGPWLRSKSPLASVKPAHARFEKGGDENEKDEPVRPAAGEEEGREQC